jgi:hypothetical protein
MLMTSNPPDHWVRWNDLARDVYGTTQFVQVVQGMCQLPEYHHLFNQTNQVVKLSPEGMQYVQNLPPQQLTEIQNIANAIRQYAGSIMPSGMRVNGVSVVALAGGRFLHAVSVDLDDEIIPSETPITFSSNADAPMNLTTGGKVVGQEPEGDILYISFGNNILPANLPGHLRIDNAFLLTSVAEKIDDMPQIPDRFKELECPSQNPQVEDQDVFNVSSQLLYTPVPWSRFLWGPPGAGKTYGLADLAIKIIQSNPNARVLLLAPSNKAVDVFVEQLLKRLESGGLEWLIAKRCVLRFGYPKSDRILNSPELLGPESLDGLAKEARDIARRLKKVVSDNRPQSEIAQIRAELLAKQEEIKTEVRAHVNNCKIVATTVTQSYQQSSPITDACWDTVLVDEVTMVPPAICVYLASLAQMRFLVAGDPRQLGPVYKNNNQDNDVFQWMGRDIFDKCGISRGNQQILTGDSRLARIVSQRRCAADIWSKIEHLYPTVDNLTNHQQLSPIAELQPSSGMSIVVIDTSSANATCERVHHSWQNQRTAEISMEIANSIIAESDNKYSVAIISPYRAQVKLIRSYIKIENRREMLSDFAINVDSGTVHQFQGSDADVVIFDMVDGSGRGGLGLLLKDDVGKRLVNVAITRARGKLIVVADKRWCQFTNFQDENPILWDLVMGNNVNANVIKIDPGITESPIEQMLYSALLNRQDTLSLIQPQYIICDENERIVSRADFAFPKLKYAIYCDGRQWHLVQDRWHRDIRQRNKLAELGWTFSVFTGQDIHQRLPSCIEQIEKIYKRLV